VHLDEAGWDRLPDRFGGGPEAVAQSRATLDALRVAMTTELTDRQQYVFTAIIISWVPLDVVVAQLGSSRDAIYQTMFDARREFKERS